MYYNLAKTAEILGLSTADVNRLREQGKLRAFKDGPDWKFRKEEVEAYLRKMIKERSGESAAPQEQDGEETTFADSEFDLMWDEQGGDDVEVTANAAAQDAADDFSLAPEEDDLVPVVEETPATNESADDFSLAPEEDDNVFELAPETPAAPANDTPLTSEDSVLAEDLSSGSGSSGSGLGINLSNSDSGLSLLDDLGGSNIDLAGGDDIVLGGSSGSGSGVNLSNSDSGLSLTSDSDGGFELDAAISEQGGQGGDLDLAPEAEAEDDGGIFELAEEAAPAAVAAASAQILNLDQSADSDAPTELAADESVFELSTETTNTPEASESLSSSVFPTQDQSSSVPNPFVTDDGEDATEEDDGGIFGLAGESDPVASAQNSDAPSESKSIDVIDENSDSFNNPFLSDESAESPFGDTASESFGDASSGIALDAGLGSDAFGGEPDAFGGFGDQDGAPFGDAGDDELPSFGADAGATAQQIAHVASTQFTGKDLIFLVPCLILLILATVGALELCRTIWSYQEGSFDLGGPILETIAKMVKLM